MALDLRKSFFREPSTDSVESENLEFKSTPSSGVPKRELSEFPSTDINSFRYGDNSSARKELQRLYKFFHSMLQPEKHSKDEIISQLSMEQFMLSGYCRDKSMLKRKWEASGRNLEKLMEDLPDDCMKPPGVVHVCMQGQEALFSEDMTLREVIVHLKKQLSAETLRGEIIGAGFQASQNAPLETRQGSEYKEDGFTSSWEITQVKDNIANPEREIDSLLILLEENCPRPEEGVISWETTHNPRRASLGTCRLQKESPKSSSYQDVPMDLGPGFFSRSDQSSSELVPTNHSNDGNPTSEGHQEISHEAQRSYRCEECPKTFLYLSHLLAHQRRHRNERPFVCAECNKGFFQTSDLRVHQMIHKQEKPFTCSRCGKSFTHKTNLRAHERIHTGEKPYKCTLCHRSFRQSSTYYRHQKIHEKQSSQSVPATLESSSLATGTM
ncbi:zinc finger and SCAN domain-containing protein 4 [Fukomys damarensis]|uniref:zinc finger and SCAN domain-containing protein 4 n=1 Tax=Fukomys damarensis TaxID=885580 RepID=UPI00053FCDA2|nr:zinc finger and SCAN domain-containing protein 4 [Fukomys damarensis]XP_010615072.1 zinc finger and SCAN domain-containing protein 4 [Fukomys damarensis]